MTSYKEIKSLTKNFFKNDPYRKLLTPIFDSYREKTVVKSKIYYKKWTGHLRGWQYSLLYAHGTYGTLEDPKGGFHFYVNPLYIPLKQLIKEVEEAGFKIVEKKRRALAMRMFGHNDGPNRREVFIRVEKIKKRMKENL